MKTIKRSRKATLSEETLDVNKEKPQETDMLKERLRAEIPKKEKIIREDTRKMVAITPELHGRLKSLSTELEITMPAIVEHVLNFYIKNGK